MPEGNGNLDLEDQEGVSAPAAKKGGGGLIKIVIILVIVVAAIGGGFFALPMIMPPPAEEESAEAEQAESTEAEPRQALFDPENPPGVLEFNAPFLIRLRRAASMLRGEVYLKVSLTLEVASDEIREEMEGNSAVMSRISDTIISYLAGKYPEDVDTATWPRLKGELIAKINEQFPEVYHIRRVNFREFVVQAR